MEKLQILFDSSIQSITELHPGYENHASNVLLIKTETEEVIVRSSQMIQEPHNDFWWGCKQLFGIDPRNVFHLEFINNSLAELSSFPVPRVLRKMTIDNKEYVVVEKLNGHTIHTFLNQPSSILESLGKGLALIHQKNFNYIGNPLGTHQTSIYDFHSMLINIMQQLTERFYNNNQKILEVLPEMQLLLKRIPTPTESNFILVDMDPTQFLSNGTEITGLVDTEAYAVAPRELDFIALEYVLDKKSAEDFIRGYISVRDIPDLTYVRKPYRYLYRLLSVQGSVGIEEWLNHPTYF
ncbi:hypothetical protein bmyco0003_56150 [Bacillus pseudomycoides]|uniref:hypothetical protein n=1 Tax=Bacillus pseudomycoides TaxID=64104 RepID=UPI0001A14F88|nr:hypothetical protein [Bacillus pseudomycoides]EEM07693.1 hypothetical protein bmyco0003_56150 [Bacillus pseudomycoides]